MRLSSAAFSLALAAISVTATPLPIDLVERQSCADVYVYFARGTTEGRPIGAVVGPPFQDALRSALGARSLVFEGVDYPALVSGYLIGGDPVGGANMANSVTSIASQCPNAKIVMSGYSQGAQVTHIAANRLSSAVQNRVSAVVTFGDPYRDTALPGVLQSRRITFCNEGDLICEGKPIILGPHLTYGADAPTAAAFVTASVKSSQV